MAAYGAQIKEGKTPAEAQAYLKTLFHNVVSQDSSARNALQTFLAGRGDALIDYEDEAITDQKKGSPIEYVIPKYTILIQNPIAIVSSGQHGGGAEVRQLPALPRRPEDLGGKRLSARDRRGGNPRRVPDPSRPVHDRLTRRMDQGGQGILRNRRHRRDRHQDRGIAGGVHRANEPGAGIAGARTPALRGRAARALARQSPQADERTRGGTSARLRGTAAPRSGAGCSACTCRCSSCSRIAALLDSAARAGLPPSGTRCRARRPWPR